MADDIKVIAEVPSFTVTLMVRRYDPEVSEEVKWVDYDVTVYGTDRVLDALHKIIHSFPTRRSSDDRKSVV